MTLYGCAPLLSSFNLTAFNPGSASIGIALTPNGELITQESPAGPVSRLPSWWGQNVASGWDITEGFEARLEVFAGAVPNIGSPFNIYISMTGAPVSWTRQQVGSGSTGGTWVLTIRNRTTGQVLATSIHNISVTVP